MLIASLLLTLMFAIGSLAGYRVRARISYRRRTHHWRGAVNSYR